MRSVSLLQHSVMVTDLITTVGRACSGLMLRRRDCMWAAGQQSSRFNYLGLCYFSLMSFNVNCLFMMTAAIWNNHKSISCASICFAAGWQKTNTPARQIPLQDKYPCISGVQFIHMIFMLVKYAGRWTGVFTCASEALIIFRHTAKCYIEIRPFPNKHKVNKVPSLFQKTQILAGSEWRWMCPVASDL